KYLMKLTLLHSDSLVDNKNYIEDDFFGLIQLDEKFKTDLFRFAIADDEQFINKTRILRLNFWKRIQESSEYQRIIKDIFFKKLDQIDETSQYYADVISAVLDTLVLRYILVRILEGRFGYENETARKSVSKVGLGTSVDKTLETKAHFDLQRVEEVLSSKKEQLSLFDVIPDDINDQEVAEIHETQLSYMENVYGGDLYVSDIAKAATRIEKTLSESEYALIWRVTSSTNLDFDLEDVTPGTIGEQYEQTLKMSLTKNISGKWEYSKDNTQQREQGAFYTNAKITDYIIDITLGKKLSEISDKLRNASSTSQKIKILRSVLKLKMADISSGGGTFLAGAVRKLGNWYAELEKLPDVKPLLVQIREFGSVVDFQKFAVNQMIYGIDLDLKALIVSSFALTLESLGDTQSKLPELIGKNLINQNSLISVVPESLKLEWFNTYKDTIKELYGEKKKWISGKGNNFAEVKAQLQLNFIDMASDYIKTKKYTKEDLEKTFVDKHIEILEFNLPEVFFDKDGNYSGGFDIIFGNPPYIQLQKKQIFSDIEKYIYKQLGEFDSYEATGDIYSLFFERATQLLKSHGLLGFITSNKYLRAGYGQSLRNYFLEKTNPYLLVNLGSGMFGATVDTSILALEKSHNKNELQAIDLVQRDNNPQKRLENMSDYIEQNTLQISFNKDDSWIILSPIEQSIKHKIESVGTPLKDWNIRINRGILTGYNEAFIIDKAKRNELIEQDPKSAEIIRPILRGRDIKRYSYEFADLYLICTFPSKHYNIDKYPAIRDYLLTFDKRKLEQSGAKAIDGIIGNNARKKTNNQWFETQDSIAYWDDFSKPKIVWADIATEPNFVQIDERIYFNNTCYMMVGAPNWFVDYLNSDLVKWYFPLTATDLGEKGTRYFKQFVEKIPIPTAFIGNIQSFFKLTDDEMNCISSSVNFNS
ncbi:Eco57I restriction-modification methylase domain-containing protein, partial [Streptococcus mutans]|nr:Eco57I restriction-modification methylase domain-containing protein [Streptococcus mutans]